MKKTIVRILFRIIKAWFAMLYFLKIQKRPAPNSIVIDIQGVKPGSEAAKDLERKLVLENESMMRFMMTYIIPDSKMQPVLDYVKKTGEKYPTMQPDRILRKAAEEFHLEKIDWSQMPVPMPVPKMAAVQNRTGK